MPTIKKEKPNDFGILMDACEKKKLDCQLHVYGTGKKAGLQIEICDGEATIETEQVLPKEKPEGAAKRLHARMKKAKQL